MPQKKLQSQVFRTLREEADRRGWNINVLAKSARRVGERFYVPVDLPDIQDASDFAFHLQDLEDSWNNQRPRPPVKLTIVVPGVPVSEF